MWSSVRQNLGKLHKFQKNLEDKIKSVEVSSSSDFTNFRFFYFLEIFNLLSHFFLLITAVLLAFSSPTFLAFVFMIATVLLTLTLNCLASLLYCPPAPLAKFQLWIVQFSALSIVFFFLPFSTHCPLLLEFRHYLLRGVLFTLVSLVLSVITGLPWHLINIC